MARRAHTIRHTIRHKDVAWPVSPAWARKHLRGRFKALASWSHEACWDRLWAILRKSDETFGQRTEGLTLEQVKDVMADAAARAYVLQTLTKAELGELKAAEAHVIVRNRADFLLGRDLAEFEIGYIDHAHGQGCIHHCGCDLLSVMDDVAMAEVRADGMANRKTHHAHYPKTLCERHAHLFAVLGGKGRLSDKLEHIHMVVRNDQPRAEAA